MGRLRIVPKSMEPGFLSFNVEPRLNPQVESNIQLQTCRGTQIRLSRDMSLRQVVRLIKLLEQG